MRNLLLVAAFAANTALIPSAQGVPGERFENWVFSAPQGWDTRENADGLRLTSPDGQATIRLLPGEELSSIGLKSWLDGQLVLLEQGLTLQTAEDPQSTATSDHYEWLVWARGLRNRQGPLLPRSYLAADPRGRAELLVFTALTAEAFQRYLPALGQFIDSVKFANVLGIPKLPPRTLPAIPVPSAADLSNLGLTAERLKIEPVPDEFRCYFRRASDDYSSPDFLLQILSGRQYRTAAGTGSFTVAAQPESGQIQWRSGPLATPRVRERLVRRRPTRASVVHRQRQSEPEVRSETVTEIAVTNVKARRQGSMSDVTVMRETVVSPGPQRSAALGPARMRCDPCCEASARSPISSCSETL
jgi:hypothetical protein